MVRLTGSLVSLLMVIWSGSSGWGQGPVKLTIPKNGKLGNLVPVTVPSAFGLAVGENAGWLAFGHDRSHADAHVSLVRLDARGNPAAYTIPLKLPKPAALVKKANYPLSLAFHPKLPLLYVWQDVEPLLVNTGLPSPADFDHLLIYSVAKETPELLASLCRGPAYVSGCAGGSLLMDEASSCLYVPNLRDPKNLNFFKFGRFFLDEAGLPKLDEKDAKLPVATRLKRLMEINAKGLSPHQVTAVEYIILSPFNTFGCGYSFYPVAKDVVIAAGWNGLITWRPEDKACLMSGLSFRHTGRNHYLAAHPHLPVFYSPLINTNLIYRTEHADGYLTQIPRAWEIPEAGFSSPPAVLAKGKQLVVGGPYRVYLVHLDDKGFPQGQVVQVPLLNPSVRALVYSQRHDRLYVAVEVSK